MSVDNINKLLENEHFFHHYQPIFNLPTGNIIGHEVLFRTPLFDNPELVFQDAKSANRLYELETKSIANAISSFLASKLVTKNRKLFINIYPSTLENPIFQDFMHKILLNTQLNKNQIIFEINEAERIFNVLSFKKMLCKLKENGYLIAIDDVGKGMSTLRAIIELEPNFVKMDSFFSFELSKSETKQEMIKCILDFCRNTGTHFLLEGIEKHVDLETAKRLGVEYGQGYLMGKPSPL